MAVNLETLALAKKFTEETVAGGGAVKGKNCVISDITTITGGQRVTFQWTLDNGTVQTRTMDVMDGISITDATIDASNHLILTLSDGNTIDSGELPVVDDAEDVAYTNVNEPSVSNVKEALDTIIDYDASDIEYTKSGTAIANVKEGLDSALSQSAQDISYTNSSDNTLHNVKQALDKALSEGAKLGQALTVSNPIGSATNGKVYAKGTSLETIIRDILIKEEAPTLTLIISPSTTLYDKVNDTVSNVTMSAVVAKKTYNLSKVEFYVDDVLKETQNINADGTYTYIATFSPATNTDFTLKAIVYDSRTGTPMSTTKSKTVKFVGKSYYGTASADIVEPTAVQIKALQNNVLKDTKNLTYSGITMEYGKVVYAYPASFSDLTSIRDLVNNINYTNSFTKTTVSVDGISYNCYIQIDPSASTNVELTFA